VYALVAELASVQALCSACSRFDVYGTSALCSLQFRKFITYSPPQVADNRYVSAPATVTVDVLPVNHAPTSSDVAVFTNEDVPETVQLVCSDVDGQTASAIVVSLPVPGTVYQVFACELVNYSHIHDQRQRY
jgi:cadherin-like protein